MVNGKSSPAVPGEPVITPPVVPEITALLCHRFYVGLALPQPDVLDPRKARINPQVANFPCLKEKCMLWNEAELECWEKTAFKAQALQGDWAHAQRNDVSIDTGGQ
jgi:hypothetical protein